jgi:hypothetical protein
MPVRASIQRVQGLLLNFLCDCICVSLVLVDDALKATQIKQVGDLGWEAVCYRIMDSRHCRVWVFMSHDTVAEPIAKRVDSELKKCIASTARRCKPGFWKMEGGRWKTGILSIGAGRVRVAQQCEKSDRRARCGLTA